MSASEPISAEVQLLLREHIDSYEKLEALLLLRSHPDREWSAAAVGRVLHIPAPAAAAVLEDLRAGGVLAHRATTKGPLFTYRPGPRLAATIDHLARLCEERRIDVMNVMNANALDRIRTSAIQRFAEAFRIKGEKGKKDG